MRNESGILLLVLAIFLSVFIPKANANLDTQKEALDTIADFADRICNKVSNTGGSEQIELSGIAKIELNNLLKIIADLGIKGGAKYQKSEYNNVLQKDLANLLKDSAKCKLDVFKELKDKLMQDDVSVTKIRAVINDVSQQLTMWPVAPFDGREMIIQLDQVVRETKHIDNFSVVHSEMEADLWRVYGVGLLISKDLNMAEKSLQGRAIWQRSLQLKSYQPELQRGAGLLDRLASGKEVTFEEYFHTLFEIMRVPSPKLEEYVELYKKHLPLYMGKNN